MDSGSNAKHLTIPMSVNFTEESPGAILKGQNPSSVANNNSSSAANTNITSLNSNITSLNTNSNPSQGILFRTADSHAVGVQAATDSGLHAKKNPSNNNCTVNSGNNNTNLISYSIVSKNNSSSQSGVRYKECLKNHAANMGGYAVDGCGEFMPSGDEGSLEALKCAACGCHRNFHRREVNGSPTTASNMSLLALPSPVTANNVTSTSNNEYGEGDQSHHHNVNVAGAAAAAAGAGTSGGFAHYSVTNPPSHHHHAGAVPGFMPHLHHHHHHQYMHSLMGSKLLHGAAHAGGHAMLGPGSAAAHGHGHGHGHGGVPFSVASPGGKRFRTKFTMEQREKMFEFSEKVGWRIQKQDEAAVQQFCADTGVKRHVLKVWMHNNKNTFGKKLLRFPEAFNALPESTSS